MYDEAIVLELLLISAVSAAMQKRSREKYKLADGKMPELSLKDGQPNPNKC